VWWRVPSAAAGRRRPRMARRGKRANRQICACGLLSTPNHDVAVIRPDLDQAAPRANGAGRGDVPSGRAVAVPTLALGESHGEVGLDLRDFSEDGFAMVAGIAALDVEPRVD